MLKVISRSTFDLQTVLNALIESATRLCDADQGAITREISGTFFRAATYGHSSDFSDYIREMPVQLDRSSVAGRALRRRSESFTFLMFRLIPNIRFPQD